MPNRILLNALACLLTAMAVAQSYGQEVKWTHYGLRPLGMGNAFVSVADDYNALFYNPAGLARLKEWDGEFLNPHAETSQSTLDLVSDVGELVQSSSGDSNAVLNLLEGLIGKTFHLNLGLTPHLVFPNFGFGVGIDLSAQAVFHRDLSMDMKFGPEVIAPIAFAMNFFDDRLSVGVGLKFVVQAGLDKQLSIDTIETLISEENKGEEETSSSSDSGATQEEPSKLKDFFVAGFGAGLDIGILFTPIDEMKPTFGLSIADFGGTKMTAFSPDLGEPKTRLPAINAGFSIRPIEANSMYVLAAIEAHAINQPHHFSKKFNLGLEWGFRQILKLQTGLHQGALSAGIQFDVGLLNLRFVTYAEQLGPIAGQDENLESRRFAIQLKLLI